MIAPARVAAHEILLSVSSGHSDLPAALAQLRSRVADERDRALAAEIATGVQRWRAALDHVIVHYARRPLERIDPEIVELLRLSIYQILHLTRVPVSASVNDAVELSRRARKQSASGFVNAVLRAVVRERHAPPLPARPSQTEDRASVLRYLSVTLSHPEWLAARWFDRLGFETTELWLRFNNAPAPLTLRANRFRATPEAVADRLSHDGIVVRAGRYAPDALIVERGHPLRAQAGNWFVVQDEASQLVALLAGRRPGLRVLDVCAAPGGKTTALADAMENRGLLVAADVRDRRMRLLHRSVAASGARNVRLVQADALQPLPFSQPFDCVLVDAPCSGLGILRRDPDIRWRRREDDLVSLAARQLVMLQRAAASVAPGGRLIYATCSSEPEENESVADAFLATSPAFVAVDLGDAGTALPAAVIDARGHLRTSPHAHGLESFFGAVFARRP